LAAFGGVLARADAALARRKQPVSLAAYDHFAIARDVLRGGVSKASLAEARSHLERALALDPALGRAWFHLTWSRYVEALNGWSDDPARAWAAFHEAAARAVAAAPEDAAVQAMAGMSHFRRREFKPGELAWRRSLELGPNDYSALREIGCNFAMALGTEHAAEGLEIVRRALRLNPGHPAWQLNCLGFASYHAGRHEDAVAALLEANDPVLDNSVFLALAHAELGEEEDAAAQRAGILELKPGFSFEAYVDNDIYRPGGSAVAMMLASARKAGLPLCAAPADAARLDSRNRLPECDAERAKAAQARS
jgi:tetratricopeptide (TPR) repeat protein